MYSVVEGALGVAAVSGAGVCTGVQGDATLLSLPSRSRRSTTLESAALGPREGVVFATSAMVRWLLVPTATLAMVVRGLDRTAAATLPGARRLALALAGRGPSCTTRLRCPALSPPTLVRRDMSSNTSDVACRTSRGGADSRNTDASSSTCCSPDTTPVPSPAMPLPVPEGGGGWSALSGPVCDARSRSSDSMPSTGDA